MKDGEYPEYVRVKFIFMNLKAEANYQGLLPRLKFVPNTWPTWLCGCHMGFDTEAT